MRRHLAHVLALITAVVSVAVSAAAFPVLFFVPAASAAPSRMPDSVPGVPHKILVTAAPSWPLTVIVQPGDSLSKIAAAYYAGASWWTQIYYGNKGRIANPGEIYPGQRFVLTAPAAVPPAAPAPPPVHVQLAGYSQSSGPSHYQAPAQPAGPVTGGGAGGTFGACVRRAENSDSYSWGDGNGGGAYQFLYSTWVGHGGNPADYGHAGPAEQDQVFLNTVAADGESDWAPYDGC